MAAVSWDSQAIPARVTAGPAASRVALPYRAVSRDTGRATKKLITVIGRKAWPAWSGLNP